MGHGGGAATTGAAAAGRTVSRPRMAGTARAGECTGHSARHTSTARRLAGAFIMEIARGEIGATTTAGAGQVVVGTR